MIDIKIFDTGKGGGGGNGRLQLGVEHCVTSVVLL